MPSKAVPIGGQALIVINANSGAVKHFLYINFVSERLIHPDNGAFLCLAVT